MNGSVPQHRPGDRWSLGALLTLGMAVSTFIQFAFGALGPVLTEELDLSRVQLGALSTAFFTSAAILSPFAGRLTDRWGGRQGLVGMFVISAAAFLGISLWGTYTGLLVGAAVGGVAMALGNPVTNLLLLVHVPEGERGVLMGVKQSGVWAGGALAGFVLPRTDAMFGWRSSLGGMAGIALLAAAAASRFSPMTARRETQPEPSVLPSAIRWLAVYAFLMGAGGAAVTTYVALFAHEQWGMDAQTAAATLVALGVSGVAARLVWARVAERSESLVSPLSWLASGAVVAGGALTLSGSTASGLLWVAVVGLGATAVAWNAAGMMVIVRVSDTHGAGRASGVVLAGFYLGLVVAPVAFGAVVDLTESYVIGWTATTGLFVAALLVAEAWRRSGRPGSSAIREEIPCAW